ncbi:unnamed protein product [Mytilus edulis]|uniref:Uncharacterized protein n=1 Tax=Mytilus edulis TaxID=6550 RepID=A0A8S3T9Z5_MYTED|nr:unnamed protein product [Mytilus edulis]
MLQECYMHNVDVYTFVHEVQTDSLPINCVSKHILYIWDDGSNKLTMYMYDGKLLQDYNSSTGMFYNSNRDTLKSWAGWHSASSVEVLVHSEPPVQTYRSNIQRSTEGRTDDQGTVRRDQEYGGGGKKGIWNGGIKYEVMSGPLSKKKVTPRTIDFERSYYVSGTSDQHENVLDKIGEKQVSGRRKWRIITIENHEEEANVTLWGVTVTIGDNLEIGEKQVSGRRKWRIITIENHEEEANVTLWDVTVTIGDSLEVNAEININVCCFVTATFQEQQVFYSTPLIKFEKANFFRLKGHTINHQNQFINTDYATLRNNAQKE